MVLSRLELSSQGKAGWGRGMGGGGGFPQQFVILPVVNELFTLALIRVVLSQLQHSSQGKAGSGMGRRGGGGS